MSRPMIFTLRTLQVLAAGLALVALAACGERPPIVTKQLGYRGTGMEQNINPRLEAVKMAANQAPATPDEASPDGPKASEVYQNVKVLGDLSVAQFSRHMAAITQWVSPQEGCNYCHNGENFADDSKYTKVVARRMIQMTQHINQDWQKHVAATGVTCYTCHRGNPVPQNVWYKPADRKYTENSVMGDLAGQNIGAKSVGLSSLPNDPFTPYLLGNQDIRVNGNEALRMTGDARNTHSVKQAEHTYGLMVHMSTALGANCTTCHNTRNWQEWTNAPPQRVTAWYGIRMARDLNNEYIVPLTDTFPANRKGPHGDVAKVYCATCHQGVQKPLYGAAMAKGFPELLTLAKLAPPLPAPLADAMKTVMYFDVGSPLLQGPQAAGMAQVIATLQATPGAKVTISGYHSAAGALDQNQELAKQRAFAVRDALTTAGIAADRVVLEKPLSAEANLAGEDPAARRAEVTVTTTKPK